MNECNISGTTKRNAQYRKRIFAMLIIMTTNKRNDKLISTASNHLLNRDTYRCLYDSQREYRKRSPVKNLKQHMRDSILYISGWKTREKPFAFDLTRHKLGEANNLNNAENLQGRQVTFL